MDLSRPIFIVGVPRSGTTLMRTMLSAHPRIAIAPETSMLSYWHRRFGWLDLNRPNEFDYFWGMFRKSYSFAHLELPEAMLRARLTQRYPLDLRTVFETVITMYGDKQSKNRAGEKTPRHHRHLQALFSWFPDASVINVIRDPRDLAASAARTPWGARMPHVYAREWTDNVRRLTSLAGSARVLNVQYERLVDNPVEQLETVCAFLGEPFDESMIIHRAEARVLSASDTGWHAEHVRSTIAPITSRSVERWRSDLSAAEVDAVEQICGSEMKALGYQLSGKRISIRARLSYAGVAKLYDVSTSLAAAVRLTRDNLIIKVPRLMQRYGPAMKSELEHV